MHEIDWSCMTRPSNKITRNAYIRYYCTVRDKCFITLRASYNFQLLAVTTVVVFLYTINICLLTFKKVGVLN